jgi:hypothetical protein
MPASNIQGSASCDEAGILNDMDSFDNDVLTRRTSEVCVTGAVVGKMLSMP